MLVDTNIILRYIVKDNKVQFRQIRSLLATTKVLVRNEVLSEVFYVLEAVYELPRRNISDVVRKFLQLKNVQVEDEDVVLLAIKTFAKTRLDFVDTLLYAYHKIKGIEVFTFDKQLLTRLKSVKG